MQWVPRSAWKKHNLNKVFGTDHIGIVNKDTIKNMPPGENVAGRQPTKTAFSASNGGESAASRFPGAAKNTKHYTWTELHNLYKVKQVPFIDVRDPADMMERPAPTHAVALQFQDILSGAARAVLPQNKAAEIVLFADKKQRAVNGFNALAHQGYMNVVVADYDAVRHLDKTAAAAQPEAGGDGVKRKRAKSLLGFPPVATS
jgi:rhodanese-related sulfurtransferase